MADRAQEHRNMSQVFDSGHRAGQKGFSQWQEAVADLFVALQVTTDDREAFRMQVQRTMLGSIMCARNASSQQHLMRTPKLISNDQEDCIGVLLIESGTTVVIQNDRQTRGERGDFVLFDTFRSYELESSAGTEQIVFQVPRELVLGRIGQVGNYTATRFSYDQPVHRLTYDFLKTLAHSADQIDRAVIPQLTAQGLDLLALSLYQTQQAKILSPSAHRSAMLYRVKTYIQNNLTNAELSLDMTGAGLGISGRYVNHLLADEHSSFRHYLSACRLERCKRDLDMPAQAHRRIGEIAYAWGFNDLAHFSRAFKQRFGVSPREWRETAALQQNP
jgi:AraC-like DNA-binding protein